MLLVLQVILAGMKYNFRYLYNGDEQADSIQFKKVPKADLLQAPAKVYYP